MTDKDKFIKLLNELYIKFIAYYKYENGEKNYYIEIISNIYHNNNDIGKGLIIIFDEKERFKYFNPFS